MATLNKVMLIGNLTRDPELRYTTGGIAVCKFSLAVNRSFTGKDGQKKEETCFIDVEVWQKLAELCGEYLKKGRAALVEGRLKQDSWEGKDGTKRTKIILVAEDVQFLGHPSVPSDSVPEAAKAPNPDLGAKTPSNARRGSVPVGSAAGAQATSAEDDGGWN